MLPWCERQRVALVGYSPFGHGRFPTDNTPGVRLLRDIAAAHGATPGQVALRSLARRPSLFAIRKSAQPERTAENAGAGDLRLSADESSRIDGAFPLGPAQRELPLL